MSVVFDRPYQFVPPHTGNGWPHFIQWSGLYRYYLRHSEGVVQNNVEGIEHFQSPLDAGHGILMTPNHCRYADPLVLGIPAGKLKTHLHAMASWHLFNRSRFDTFALRKMGAFSLNREGSDRSSIDQGIQILTTASRPLIIFPEGATYRTNDVLKPLLEGVTFIARTAARRAAKVDRKVVILPVAIKYLCIDPVAPWADRQLSRFEREFGWSSIRPGDRLATRSLLERTMRVAAGMLALKEAEFDSPPADGSLAERRDRLIAVVLQRSEKALGIAEGKTETGARVRAIRSEVASQHFDSSRPGNEPELRRISAMADLALQLRAYPESYLDPAQLTDTRLVETIQRMQESLYGAADASIRLSSLMRFSEPIAVPASKPPRGETDPLLRELEDRLKTMLQQMATLARPMTV